MKGRDYLDMVDSLRPGITEAVYRRRLCERLDLDTSRRIHDYSSGNKQKLGLIAALMDRPKLLVLDEPTVGLDPLVQQTVLELVREARDEGRTIFFSSHILSEVQAVCDRVGIIREGRLIKVERVDALTAQPFHRLRLRFNQEPAGGIFELEGVQVLSRDDDTVFLEVRKNLPLLLQKSAEFGINDIETQPVTLEEVFLAYYGRSSRNNHVVVGQDGGQNA